MTIKTRHKQAYMESAEVFAKCSYAERLKVGTVIVKDGNLISHGWNGMPSGMDNCCEDKVYLNDDPSIWDKEELAATYPFRDNHGGHYRLETKPEVLHAERNALDKLARNNNEGALGATMFATHSPCLECAKSIGQSGIREVIYREVYRSTDGIDYLRRRGVKVTRYGDENE